MRHIKKLLKNWLREEIINEFFDLEFLMSKSRSEHAKSFIYEDKDGAVWQIIIKFLK